MAIYSRFTRQKVNNRRFCIRKKNASLNLISQQDDIDKIYLYAKGLSIPKYEFFINRREDAG